MCLEIPSSPLLSLTQSPHRYLKDIGTLFLASSYTHLVSVILHANLSSLYGSYYFCVVLCPGLSSKRPVWVSVGIWQLLQAFLNYIV